MKANINIIYGYEGNVSVRTCDDWNDLPQNEKLASLDDAIKQLKAKHTEVNNQNHS